MKAVMLAAGVGARLADSAAKNSPKILLNIGEESLLQRHIEILKRHGIDELVIGVGHQHQEIEQKIVALGAQDFVRTVYNENFEEGSIVTLWTLRDELCCGEQVLLMDADVLYDEEAFSRLLNSRHQNCLLLDRAFESGDEPVKICIRDGEIVEFRKWLSAEYDFCGESVGFFKLSAKQAKKIISQTELYLRQGRRHEPYEEPLRDVLLTSQPGTFSFEDITGLSWIEIDFSADLERASSNILPRILRAKNNSKAVLPIIQDIDQLKPQAL
ncbi:MAG: phosphocholine cytidylyltransferase family protein [Alphaproteobacteria bacterium]|nr:phosphocholine cytidylyltransferase family protein [Alphaproteobacteria bacterium]